jgi:molybdopterin converting factor small subunit
MHMKITVNFLGTLSKYTGAELIEIELDEDARYGDLLAELNRRYGDKFPAKCWDKEKCDFVKPISAIGSNGDIEARDTPLAGHDEINILIPISGGMDRMNTGSGLKLLLFNRDRSLGWSN